MWRTLASARASIAETGRDQIEAFLNAGAERVSVWASHCDTEAEMGEQLERMAHALTL